MESFSKCETELIRIMDQVKKGAISQEDALMLYQACELNHGREDSKLKKKKDNLEKIKEDGISKHTGLKHMLSKILGGRKSPSNLEAAYSSVGRRPSNAQVSSLPPEKKQVRTLPAPKKRYLNEMAGDDYDVVARRASSGARFDSNPARHPTYDSNQRAPAVPPRPDIDSGEEDTRSKVPPPPYRVESNSKSHPDCDDIDDDGDRSDGYLPLYDTNDDHEEGDDEVGYYTCVSERKSSKEDIKKGQGGRGDAPEPPPPRNPPTTNPPTPRRKNVGPTQLSVPERLNPPIPYNHPRKCSLPENMYSGNRRPVPVPGSGRGKVSALGRGGNSAESMFSVVEENG